VNGSSVSFVSLDAATLSRVQGALRRIEPVAGAPLEIVVDAIMIRGDRYYVPVRPKDEPKSMFSFFEAVAGAEVQLRSEGLDIQLTPEYAQPYVVAASFGTRDQDYLYLSREGEEYGDLGRLLGVNLPVPGEHIMIEGFPYDGQEDRERAIREARSEHPNATLLGELAQGF
jgi:hypothetical protein